MISHSITAGDRLPDHVQEPISRTTLALFAGASNDHVRLHIDSDYAKEAGMPDVFAHGMLSMAYMGQLLTNWVPQKQLRHWHVRFLAITPLYAAITCRGEVLEVFEDQGEQRARLKVSASTQDGTATLDSEAVVALS